MQIAYYFFVTGNDCENMKVGITLQSENWKTALHNRESIEFKTLESKLLSEVSFLWSCIHIFCFHVHPKSEF